jgi:hypothetical protein
VQQRNTEFGGDLCHIARPVAVDSHCERRLALGHIDSRVGGRVDDSVAMCGSQSRYNRPANGEIEVRPTDCDHFDVARRSLD